MSILVLPNPLRSDNGGIPSGLIAIWSGTEDNIPSGWHLCDGNDGTPDLRDKFVLGAGESHSVGETGGAEEVTLTGAQMPVHSHWIDVRYNTSIATTSSAAGYPCASNNSGQTTNGSSTRDNGSNQPHPNMPPYYALCYIIKL